MQFRVMISAGDIPLRSFDDWTDAAKWANKELDVPWYVVDSTGRVVWESFHGKKLYVCEVFEDGAWVSSAFHATTDIRGMLDTWGSGKTECRIRRVKTKQEACEIGWGCDPVFGSSHLDIMEWVKCV